VSLASRIVEIYSAPPGAMRTRLTRVGFAVTIGA
jgi:hypothetical protein